MSLRSCAVVARPAVFVDAQDRERPIHSCNGPDRPERSGGTDLYEPASVSTNRAEGPRSAASWLTRTGRRPHLGHFASHEPGCSRAQAGSMISSAHAIGSYIRPDNRGTPRAWRRWLPPTEVAVVGGPPKRGAQVGQLGSCLSQDVRQSLSHGHGSAVTPRRCDMSS